MRKRHEEERQERQKARRRRKIGPMVIDYFPRIPRIPYSDRPYGPKIKPSITGAALSFFFLSSHLLFLLFIFFHPLSLIPGRFTREPLFAALYFLALHKNVISSFGNALLY